MVEMRLSSSLFLSFLPLGHVCLLPLSLLPSLPPFLPPFLPCAPIPPSQYHSRNLFVVPSPSLPSLLPSLPFSLPPSPPPSLPPSENSSTGRKLPPYFPPSSNSMQHTSLVDDPALPPSIPPSLPPSLPSLLSLAGRTKKDEIRGKESRRKRRKLREKKEGKRHGDNIGMIHFCFLLCYGRDCLEFGNHCCCLIRISVSLCK